MTTISLLSLWFYRSCVCTVVLTSTFLSNSRHRGIIARKTWESQISLTNSKIPWPWISLTFPWPVATLNKYTAFCAPMTHLLGPNSHVRHTADWQFLFIKRFDLKEYKSDFFSGHAFAMSRFNIIWCLPLILCGLSNNLPFFVFWIMFFFVFNFFLQLFLWIACILSLTKSADLSKETLKWPLQL